MKHAVILALLLFLVEGGAHAQAATDAAVKAAFMVKFGGYVGWPAGADESLVLCVIGHDPFGAALDRAAAGQQVNGRAVLIRRLTRLDRDTPCALAFLGGAPVQEISSALAAAAGRPVLTITDSRIGPERGIIHFQIVQNRVRFHIDEKRAAAGGLTISSKLLALAVTVRSRMTP